MKWLIIDTSSPCGVIVISENHECLSEVRFVSKESYSCKLLPSIEWSLQSLGMCMQNIDAFGITVGPGSFTGLRIGISTVKGFAWVMKKPMVGLCSLEILAYQTIHIENTYVIPMIGARKASVYAAVYQWKHDRLETLIQPMDMEVSKLISSIQGNMICVGEGALLYQKDIMKQTKHTVTFGPDHMIYPLGVTLSKLCQQKFDAGEVADAFTIGALYLRKSAAEETQQRKEKE